MKSNIYLILALSAAMLTASCRGKKETAPDVKCVNVATVQDENSLAPVTYTGKTKSAEDVAAAFRVSGQIISVKVKEGDYVHKGQVIAEMDPRDYQLQLNATQAEYEQIKADCERVIALYNEGNTTAQNYDKARYGLEQITQKLNNHRNQLSDTKLKAPISGYVQTKHHEAGETVAAGMPVVTLFGNSGIEVEIQMPAADYARRSQFVEYNCTFDILPGETFPLEVSRVSQEANSNQLYTIRLRLKGNVDHSKITPGITTMVNAIISSAEETGMVVVPSGAVVGDGGKASVFVYDESSKTVRNRAVDIQSINRDGTTTLASGVKAGEKVVSTGAHHVKDGEKVEIIKPASPSNVGGLL